MNDALAISILATLCLSLVAAVFTAMLRVGGIGGAAVGGRGPGGYRGTAIVGGIVAGVLAGPGVLGQVSPEVSRKAFVGASEEVRAYDELLLRQRADIAALNHAGVTGIAIDELIVTHEFEREPLADAIDAAKRDRRALFDGIATVFAGVCLLAAGACAVPGRRGARRTLARALKQHPARVVRSSFTLTIIGIGIPAAMTYAFAVRDARVAIAFALAIGMVGISGGLAARARWIAFGGALLGWVLAGALAPSAHYAALTLAIFAGFAVALLPARGARRLLLTIARWAALPALSALLAVRIDVSTLPAQSAFWFLMIGSIVWCSDGRWFAARMAMGAAGARQGEWSRAKSLVNAGPGTVSLVLALLFANAGIASEAFIAAALMGGAVVELFRGFREFAGPILDD